MNQCLSLGLDGIIAAIFVLGSNDFDDNWPFGLRHLQCELHGPLFLLLTR